MTYKIKPFVGVNNFEFGIKEKVFSKNFKHLNFNRNEDGNIVKLNTKFLSFTFEDGVFVEVSIIDNPNDVVLNDINIFKDLNVLKKLNEKYTYESKLGFLIYNDIGIALSGFNNDEEKRSITIYRKGYWDDIL